MAEMDAERARHRQFFAQCQLALSIAVLCTFFGVATYSTDVRQYIFGQSAKVCDKRFDWFPDVNGTRNKTKEDGQVEPGFWCGHVPKNYKDAWPTLMTMIVFTAYQNTGTTVHKAWEGFIGTAMAVLNMFVMDRIFPDETNHTHFTWVAWLDVFGFIFLVLISGSAENTMKFALSTHVLFMMTFVNPNKADPGGFVKTSIPGFHWDQHTVTVLTTAAIGCAIAILATVFPSMLLNYKNVASDAESTQKSISRLWGEAIEYFCGSKVYVKRYVIAETITKINNTIAGVQRNLDSSWWETFDLCGFGRKRTLYNIYDTTMQRMGRQMIALQDCVVNVDFGKGHKEFCDATHDGMVALKDAASELLEKCQKACQDGTIDSEEEDELEEAVMLVKERQGKLLSIFGTAACGTHLNHQMEFCFILSVWARKTVDCAESMIECDNEGGQSFLHVMWQGLWKTWQVPSRSKLIWAIRNFISVATAFVVGYQWPCWGEDAVQILEYPEKNETKSCDVNHIKASLFTPYDANMAMTLSLLINHYPGAALVNNIQRLLGVVMGKVIPMVIHGALFIFGVHRLAKSLVLGCSLFIFTWGTTYMYYSSERWSLVGRLMAGFGCALLSRPMDEEKLVNYTAYYKELAQVVMAICFQMLVDLIFDWMEGGFPRDSAVKKVREAKISIKKAFQAFFDGNLQTLIEATRDAEVLIKAAKDLWFEVDPGMQLTPGYRAKFKADLYRSALLKLELLCSDLVMLILATRVWKGGPTPQHGNDKIALEDELDSESEEEEASSFNATKFLCDLDSVIGQGGIKEELLRYIDLVLDSLEALLVHGAEDNNFQDASKTRELITLKRFGFLRMEEFHAEIDKCSFGKINGECCVCEDPNARVAMAANALIRAKARVGDIMTLIMPYIHL